MMADVTMAMAQTNIFQQKLQVLLQQQQQQQQGAIVSYHC
jgi:hypothetical protein